MADLANTTWQATLAVRIDDTLGNVHHCTTRFPLTFDATVFASTDTLFTMTDAVYAQCPGQDSVLWHFSGMGLFVYELGDTIVLRRQNNVIDFARVAPRSVNDLRGPVDPNYFPLGLLRLTR